MRKHIGTRAGRAELFVGHESNGSVEYELRVWQEMPDSDEGTQPVAGVTIGEGDLIGTSEQLLATSLSDDVCIVVGGVQVPIAIDLPMLGDRPSAAFTLRGAFPDL